MRKALASIPIIWYIIGVYKTFDALLFSLKPPSFLMRYHMEFNRTRKLIFSRCLNRVNIAIKEREKAEKKHITHKDLHENESLISAFFSYNGTNNSLAQNNPYLLTPALIGECEELKNAKRNKKKIYSIKTSKYQYDTGLLGTLPYFESNLFYLLWGKDDEFNSYIPELFIALIKDVLDNDSPYSETINYSLFDHVNYAFYKTIYDLKIKHNVESTLLTFGIFDTHFIPGSTLDICLNNAILRLYRKEGVADSFKTIFSRFAETQFSYKYLENHIEKALLPELIDKLFSVYVPNEKSLGLRVHQLIKTDIEKVIWTSSTTENSDELKLAKSLVNITSRYVTELQEIEKIGQEKNISI